MWHFLPSGFLLMATWFCSHFVSLPYQAKQWQWCPTVSSLRVLYRHLVEPPISRHSRVRGPLSSFFHHLTWICHLFPSRTSTDAVNKKQYYWYSLCRQNHEKLFRSIRGHEMLTTVDLALSYLCFLLATPHQVGIRSESLPQGPTSKAPKLAQDISK